MSIIQRVPWMVQPQIPVGIDSRFTHVWCPSLGSRDLVGQAHISGIVTKPTNRGVAFYQTVVGESMPSTNLGSTHTIFILAYPTAADPILGPGGDAYNIGGYCINSSAGTIYTSPSDGTYTTFNGSPTIPLNRWSVCVLRAISGTAPSLFIDGIKYAGAASIGTSALIATRMNSVATPKSLVGYTALVASTPQALSDAEVVKISGNLWQIFAPLPRRIWAPSTGGSPTYTLPASTASFALSGTATSLQFNRALTAASGSFSLSGTNTAVKFNRVLSAGSGVFLFTGTDSTLTYSGTTYKLTASSGSFALNGTNVTFTRGRVIQLGNGSFSLSGTSATLTYSGAPPPSNAVLYLDLLSGKVFLLKQL